MGSKPKMNITKEREVRTYAEMWQTANFLLRKGQEDQDGCEHLFRGSLVFIAFTLEAYLNHIGSKIFNSWEDLGRLNPRAKINIIAEKLEINIDYGVRPWQVTKKLFGFRNEVAHGKTELKTTEEVRTLQEFSDEDLGVIIRTNWEEDCNLVNAEKARDDVEKIVKIFHDAGGFENEDPFTFGFQFHGATLIEE